MGAIKIKSATFRPKDGAEPSNLVKAALNKANIVEAKKE